MQVEADAESVVLAVVVVGLGTSSSLGCYIAAVVEGTHVAEVDAETL